MVATTRAAKLSVREKGISDYMGHSSNGMLEVQRQGASSMRIKTGKETLSSGGGGGDEVDDTNHDPSESLN